VLGEWQRAELLLSAMAEESVEVAEGVVLYRKLLGAEAKRREFLQGGAPPILPLGDAVLRPYLAAVKLLSEGKTEEAASLLDQAESVRPKVSGVRSGVRFADLRDADDRFAAVLEVLIGDEYVWLPLAKLRSLRIYAPSKLRDLVFAPAMVDWGQGLRPVFVPVRYPGSEHDSRPEVQLSRQTTTRPEPEVPVLCLGQRLLIADSSQLSLLSLDLMQLDGEKTDGAV
jgi:type VI secretion system protein ImpE